MEPVIKWAALPTVVATGDQGSDWAIISAHSTIEDTRLPDLLVVPRHTQVFIIGLQGAPDVDIRFSMINGIPEASKVAFLAGDGGRGVRGGDLDGLPLEHLCRTSLSLFARTFRADFHGDPKSANPWQDAVPAVDTAAISQIFEIRVNFGWENTLTSRGIPEFETPIAPRAFDALFSRKRGVTKAELEQVAYIYKQNIHKKNPTEAVERNFGYSGRTASRRVKEAREAGLLPPTTQGRKRA